VKGRDEQIVNRWKQVIIIEHNDFQNDVKLISLYATHRWFKVDEEGPKEGCFESGTQEEDIDSPREETVPAKKTPAVAFWIDRNRNLQISDGDLAEMAGIIGIDYDTKPAPKNAPKRNEIINTVFTELGHDGICFC